MTPSKTSEGAAATVEYLEALRLEVNQRLSASLEGLRDRRSLGAIRPPARLLEAMRYSLLAGGKRLRPVLVLVACEATGGRREDAWPAALAIEYLHTYSLIHDDLPAMDDDDLRRGRPTLHRAFDEATAILAGDALLTEAFGLLARARRQPARLVIELAQAAGSCGMVGGQQLDIEAEHRPRAEIQLETIHRAKTARLFVAAAAMGGLAAGAPQRQIALLRRYGAVVGHAFQVADDLIDVVGDAAATGKGLGRDAARGKYTYVVRDGIDATRCEARRLGQRARELAEALGERAAPLVTIAERAVERVA
ncbi:MAG: polyprenyl synthetase family protein [Deltaproteobacteria bacterium]|nr:polyprenyl synthetase family protein [Deltaproteobacteria bacterium]